MTLREVKVSNEETVFNVPEEISDEEIIEEYRKPIADRKQDLLEEIKTPSVKSTEQVKEEDSKDVPTPSFMGLPFDTLIDVADYAGIGPGSEEKTKDQIKTVVSMGVNAYDNAARFYKNIFTDELDTPEQRQKFADNIKRLKPELYQNILETLGKSIEDAEAVQSFDENGNPVIKYQIAALGTETLPYLLPGAAFLKLKNTLAAGGAFAAGEALIYQLFTSKENVNESLTNEVFNYFPKLKQLENETLAFLSTQGIDPGDETVARFKMGMDTPALAAFFAAPSVVKYVKNLGYKPEQLLTVDEQKDIAVSYLKDNYARAVKLTNIEGDGIIPNTLAAVRRTISQFLTTRGFFDPKTYEAKQKAINELKGNISRAGDLSVKLDQALTSIASQTSEKGQKIRTLALEALGEGFEVAEYSASNISSDTFKQILRKQEKYNSLPDNVVDLIVEARVSIDKMSAELAASQTFKANKDDLTSQITQNVGTYLTRAYKLHQGGWTPSKRLQEDTISWLAKKYQRQNPNDAIAVNERRARQDVNNLISSPNIFEPGGTVNFETLSGISSNLLKGKQKIAPEIRKLMGEIEDPSAIVLNSLAKVSTLVSQSRFLDDFYANNKKLGLLKDENYVPTGADEKIFNFQIKNTNSKLDGMWTTPEIGIALQDRETALTPLIGATFTDKAAQGGLFHVWGKNNAVASLAAAKGFTQKMKTVWNITSHQRNAAGGLILTVSQGHNPFSKDALTAFKIASKKGDEFYTDFHNQLLDLGLLDTNTRVSEFKELLTEYRRIADEGENAPFAAEQFSNWVNNRILKKLGSEKYNVGNAVENVDQLLQDVYIGTDDFYKGLMFLKEKEILKKAYPDLTEQNLALEAAKKVKDLYPNYNRVPKGVKSLRNIPLFGAFVSFPSEIIRTTVKTFDIAANEVASGNPTLVKKGLQRIASMSVIGVAGAYTTEKATSAAVGWTEDQLNAFKEMYSVEYGPQSYAFTRDEDGNVISHNLTFTDPKTTIVAPMRAAFAQFEQNKITREEYNEQIINAVYEGVKEFVSPFVSETVLNQASVNFFNTVTQGKRPAGGAAPEDFFDTEADLDTLNKAFANFLYDVGPGFLRTGKKVKDVLVDEDSGGFFNESADKGLFITSQLTTLAAQKVNIPKKLEAEIIRYTINANKLKDFKGYRADNIEEYIELVVDRNKKLKENAQSLYLKMKAFEKFYSEDVTSRNLAKNILDTFVENYGAEIGTISLGISPTINLKPEQLRKETKNLVNEGKLPRSYTEFYNLIERLNPTVMPESLELAEGTADKIILERQAVREGKAKGGLNLYSRVSRFGEKQAAKHYGITSEVLKKYTKDTADLVNTLVDKGFFNEKERAKPNKEGNLSGGDVFNAANHLRTAVLAKDSINLRNLAQLKELAQFVAGDRGPHGALGDSKNNLLGFKFYDQAKGDKEKFDALVAHNLVERFSKRKGKAVGGEVDVPNAAPEPDERIDKMTGLPYNLQAGIPFRDEEDPLKRLGLAGGGRTGDPLNRLGFGTGGVNLVKGIAGAVLEASERGAKEFEGVKEQIELGVEQVSNAFKYLIDSKGVDEVVSGKGKAPVVEETIKPLIGRSGIELPQYLYHYPYKRGFNEEGGIDKYTFHPTAAYKGEKQLENMVMLSRTPEGTGAKAHALKIDVSKLPNYEKKLIDLHMSEGHFSYKGDIPAKAISRDVKETETPRSVMPAPQRFFDPEDKAFKPFLGDMGKQPGGRYLEMGGKSPQDITGEFPSKAVIGVTPEGKPVMQVSKELLEGEVRTDGRKIKTNLFKKKAGWKWTKTPEGFDPNPPSNFPLVSVEDGRQHYYSLRTEFPEGVELTRYEKSKSEPRLRPTKKGNVHLGEVVGEISVRGKKHPVYDQIKVYGLAGATASSLLQKEEPAL